MIKQEELRVLRVAIALLREAIAKTGYKARRWGFRLKEPGYSTKDAIDLLKIKRGDNRGKD